MAKTGPQKIPGASLTYFYGDGVFSGSDMEINCGVAHTTEGRTVPSYADGSGRRGANAPTVTGLPDCKARRLRWYQHYDVDESARALANKLGGVSTNTANVFQIELVGTCDPKTRDAWVRAGHRQDVDFIFWPEAPDWALAEVAWLVRWLHDNHGVPLTCVKDWLAYGVDTRRPGVTPASYGASPARMSFGEWQAFKGWCGHQHVPENDHGDPGSMDFARVIALAKGAATEEDDMPTVDEIARKVLNLDGEITIPGAPTTNPTYTLASTQTEILKRIDKANTTLAAQTAAITALAGQLGEDVDTATVVAAVQQAIADAVVSVDVNVHSKES